MKTTAGADRKNKRGVAAGYVGTNDGVTPIARLNDLSPRKGQGDEKSNYFRL
jgi:hypothetical protein